MKRIYSIVLALALVSPLTGCFVHTGPGHGHSSKAKKTKTCKPSQHWDGHQCRHNGKGKGARKHDGR
jgi:hypothetical protein